MRWARSRLTLAQTRSFFNLLPALPLRRFASCITGVARALLLRSYSCCLFRVQARRYLGCLGVGAFLGRTSLSLPGRLLRKRLLARYACCFPLGSPRLARLDDPPPLFLQRLSCRIIGAGVCTEFLEQRRLRLCRCGLLPYLTFDPRST